MNLETFQKAELAHFEEVVHGEKEVCGTCGKVVVVLIVGLGVLPPVLEADYCPF